LIFKTGGVGADLRVCPYAPHTPRRPRFRVETWQTRGSARTAKGQTRGSARTGKGQTRRSARTAKGQTRRSAPTAKGQTRRYAPTAPAAGIDEATPQGPKRQTAAGGQSDFRSYCPPPAGPFSDRGVARKARLPPKKFRKIPGRSRATACLGSDQKKYDLCESQNNDVPWLGMALACLGFDWIG
jgi:hypothetical protein